MPEPVALCLEDTSELPGSARYTRCVAVRGDQPGLGVDLDGGIVWRSEGPVALELWVSADERLILLRPKGAAAVRVSRAGRSLEVPCGKPVVLLDQDLLHTALRSFRLHVHGPAEQITAPAPLVERHSWGRLAATVALGVAAVSCNKTEPAIAQPVEVREQPPAPMEPPPEPDASVPEGGEDGGGDGAAQDAGLDGAKAGDAARPDAAKRNQPIEIRHRPPKPVSRDPNKF